MNNESIRKQFSKMGADILINKSDAFNVDVSGRGFSMEFNEDHEVIIVDINKKDRHLLLVVKELDEKNKHYTNKKKYLCGHDERDWFVAAVPSSIPNITNVSKAKEALKPNEIREIQDNKKVKRKKRNKRKNDGFIRQGEWFFISQPNLEVDEKLIIRDEPIRRGRGKPHMVEYVYRTGGVNVYIHYNFPNGVSEIKYRELINSGEYKRGEWQVMRQDAMVFCKGRVSHPDHATITLNGWYKVIPNTEASAPGIKNMAFLD
jgi:hypothetical protein